MRRKSCVACLALLLAYGCHSAVAADFTVTATSTTGPGSLHQAINDANATPGPDRIVFDIPAAGVQRINVNGNALPPATDPVVIDGYTQPGSRANSLAVGNDAVILIHVDARGPVSSATQYGIKLEGGNSTVRGLCFTGFRKTVSPTTAAIGAAILVDQNGGNTIEGNFIGVLPDGQTPGHSEGETETSAPRADGVSVHSGGNTIGGSSPEARNLISGNGYGIAIMSGSSTGSHVFGNYIGTDASGTTALANNTGILAAGGSATPTLIGASGGGGNVISGNSEGVIVAAVTRMGFLGVSDVTIQANLIGFAANGRDRLPNRFSGIRIRGIDIVVGGTAPSEGNRIAVDESAPATAPSAITAFGLRNPILSNQIVVTTAKAIDLGAAYNDLGDGDSGWNERQNFPIIIHGDYEANGSTGTGTIEAALNSKPTTEFTLQFFLNSREDSELLGTTTARTDAQGTARITFEFTRATGEPLADGSYFTATATDPVGNTSEYFPQNGPVQLANISTRGFVGTEANILIGGFIIRSDQPKRIGVRALGPSVNVPDRLQDPVVAIYDAAGNFVAANDDWKTGGQQQDIMLAQLAPESDAESVVLAVFSPGVYTAHVSGADSGTGNALVELYDLDPFTVSSGRMINISTRGLVRRGDSLLIGGLIVRGNATSDVVARAIGPDLTARGVPNALQDPVLELRDASGELVAVNDNWRENQNGDVPPELQPEDDRNAVVFETLPPGSYTAVVSGKGDMTGVALVEFYDLEN